MKNKFYNILLILVVVFMLIPNITYATTFSLLDENGTINPSITNNEDLANSDIAVGEVEVYGEAATLLDVDADKFLYAKNYKKRMYPASTTKLMTAIIVLENCEDLSQLVNISYCAVHRVPYSYSIANLYAGEQFTIKQLLDSLLIASANDSAYALAEYVANGGNNYLIDNTEEAQVAFDNSMIKFSEMMNNKAKEIGCLETNFVNPNGIHNDNHYSTAYDLTLIGKYAYSNSIILDIAKKLDGSLPNSSIYNDEERFYTTTNLLINPNKNRYYQYANGLKTGYTDVAQSCIIASAQKDNRNLIVVILHFENNETTPSSRENDCINLFEYGFNNFTVSNLIKSNEIARNLSIVNGNDETKNVDALVEKDLYCLIKNGEALDITPNIEITKAIAPISEGEVIGTISYTIDGKTYTSNLLASHDVYAVDYMNFIIGLIVALLVLILLYVHLNKKTKRKNKNKNNSNNNSRNNSKNKNKNRNRSKTKNNSRGFKENKYIR